MEQYAGYLGNLDMFLEGHPCFSSSASSTSSSYPASNQNIDWKEFSPRINDYNNVLARAVAEGTGQIVKGIFKCSNAYTNKIQKGQEMTLRSAPELSNTLRYQKTNGGRDYDAQKKSAVNRSLKRFGESAGEATEDVLATAGHCVGAAWNIFKIRKIRKSQSSSPGVRNHVLEDLERLEDVFVRGGEEETTATAMEDVEDSVKLSIYRAARTIKRRNNSLYNALKSIYEDSIFVGEISQLWPDLPLLANLRCGLWYSPRFHSTCYFKSTDGHNNNWSFNTSRLNLHVVQLALQKGGCIIVDSTRKGKRFPDSMSKTIPIWTCVLNRCIARYRSKMLLDNSVAVAGKNDSSKLKQSSGESLHWDCSLHLPLWVSDVERASIEARLETWTDDLETIGADVASLVSLKKPLRPLWISQRTVIWLNEVPDHDSWDFTPIILLSASRSTELVQNTTTSEFSWSYISGAGDDEESWARGLSPSLFWVHAYDLINAGPDSCNQKVADIVEKDRVYRAHRGLVAPQIRLNAPTLSGSLDELTCAELAVSKEHSITWLASTSIAIGSVSQAANALGIDCMLNCSQDSVAPSLQNTDMYMHLPVQNSKFDRFSLLNNLPSAVNFARANLGEGRTILLCCKDGEDVSICVCLAILVSLFTEEGTYDEGRSFNEAAITKWEMRRRLVFICKYVTAARPSRGNLKQVFAFLTGGRASSK